MGQGALDPTRPEPRLSSRSINFNQGASLICVSSDHGTVHVFAAEDPKRNKQSRWVCVSQGRFPGRGSGSLKTGAGGLGRRQWGRQPALSCLDVVG